MDHNPFPGGVRAEAVRLFPSEPQGEAMLMFLDACRDAYNHSVGICRECAVSRLPVPCAESLRSFVMDLRASDPRYSPVHPDCMLREADRASEAFSVYRRAVESDGEAPLPGFRPYRGSSFSYGMPSDFRMGAGFLELRGIGRVRFRSGFRTFAAYRTCSVRLDPAGDWYALLVRGGPSEGDGLLNSEGTSYRITDTIPAAGTPSRSGRSSYQDRSMMQTNVISGLLPSGAVRGQARSIIFRIGVGLPGFRIGCVDPVSNPSVNRSEENPSSVRFAV